MTADSDPVPKSFAFTFNEGQAAGMLLKISPSGEILEKAPNAAGWPAELRPIGLMVERHAAEIARLVGALKEVEDMADGEYLHSSIAHFARKALDSAGG
jgi:hypothetical protein